MDVRQFAFLARQPSAALKPRDAFFGLPKRGLVLILANALFWQPLLAQAEGIVVSAPGTTVGQAGNGFPGAAETEIAEPFDGIVLIDLAEPQAGQRVLAGLRVGEHLLEMAADDVAMLVEHDQHGLPVGEAHAAPLADGRP